MTFQSLHCRNVGNHIQNYSRVAVFNPVPKGLRRQPPPTPLYGGSLRGITNSSLQHCSTAYSKHFGLLGPTKIISLFQPHLFFLNQTHVYAKVLPRHSGPSRRTGPIFGRRHHSTTTSPPLPPTRLHIPAAWPAGSPFYTRPSLLCDDPYRRHLLCFQNTLPPLYIPSLSIEHRPRLLEATTLLHSCV